MYPQRQPPLYAEAVADAEYVPTARTRTVLAQLQAEIAAHQETVKSVALAMGRPYVTFRRYVIGERPMPADDLLDALDVLGLDYATFMRRAGER